MPSAEYDRLYKKLQSLPPVFGGDIQDRRADMEKAAVYFPVSADVSCEPFKINDMPAEWISSEEAPDEGVVLYLHGGGYCIGSIDSYRHFGAHLARASRRRTLLIDYRLSPEHSFPAALDDAVEAYRWLLDRGVTAEQIVIGGDSAGGGLALATLLKLREEGVALPSGAVVISPWTDLTASGESIRTRAEVDPLIKPDRTNDVASWYLGDKDPTRPMISPLFADLTGLPPMLIQVGTRETLLDDSTRFAEAAARDGVAVTLDVWEEMFHVWHYYADWIPEGREAFEKIGVYIRARLSD